MKKIKSNYWQNRSAKFLVSQLEISEKAIRRMNPVYSESYNYLQEQGRSIFEAYLRKQSFTEAEARRIVSSVNDFTDINDIKKAMLKSTDSKAMKEIVKEMDSAPFTFRINRLMEMSNDIDSVSKRISKAQLGATANALNEIAKKGYKYKLSEIDEMVGFNVSSELSDLDQEYVDKLMNSKWKGSNYSKRIWKSGNKLSKSLKEEFLVNYLTGRSNAQMAEKLAERFGVSLFDARRIVRTEATYIQGEVDAKAYEDTGVSEYEFVAVLDSRTSKICNELDGKKFQVKDRQAGTNYPPMHPFCRSTTIAVIDVDRMYNNALTNYRISANEKMININTVTDSTDFMGQAVNVKPVDKEFKVHQYLDSKIYIANYSKATQNVIKYVVDNLEDLEENYGTVDKIAVLKQSQMVGLGGFDREENIIYLSSELGDKKKIKELLKGDYFAANNLEDAVIHEFAHKKHRQAIKDLYENSEKGYNNIREAEEDFNRPIREFIKRQLEYDPMYMNRISRNAKEAYDLGNVFEYISELFVNKHNGNIQSAENVLLKDVFKI